MPLPKLTNVKSRLLAVKNARTVKHMTLLQECSELLQREKAQLQLSGQAPTWANFQQTAVYAEFFSGIDASTIEIARKLWEEIKA